MSLIWVLSIIASALHHSWHHILSLLFVGARDTTIPTSLVLISFSSDPCYCYWWRQRSIMWFSSQTEVVKSPHIDSVVVVVPLLLPLRPTLSNKAWPQIFIEHRNTTTTVKLAVNPAENTRTVLVRSDRNPHTIHLTMK
jgi:hypothetical protein